MNNPPPNLHLCTPLDWAVEALARASKLTGTTEGERALVEANRYKAFSDVVDYMRLLEGECAKTREENAALKNQLARFRGWNTGAPS